ncbi:MAG: glycosyltransferase family 39 protein [Deltaproteobacteria bacterium]|nr:glycosyltransferase family 39 protein [Deltaproteobacteria bacterium]
MFVEKAFVLILGKNEFSLRIFPLISFLISIPYFYFLSKKLLNNQMMALMATSIYSITLSLINYSSEVKQYSIDVLLTILIFYYCLTLQLDKNRSLVILSIIGSVAVWFSNTSIIILFIAGIYLIYSEGLQNRNFRIAFILVFWIISFFIYYFLFILDHPTKEIMIAYWRDEGGFLPLNILSKEFYNFLFEIPKSIYSYLLGYGPFWLIPFVISLTAIVILFKQRQFPLLYFCLAPIVVHVLLSALELYPFKDRLILYITPLIIIIFSIGLYSIFEFINRRIIKLSYLLLIIPVFSIFYPIYLKYPIKKEEIKLSLNYINHNINNMDIIYVHYGAFRAFKFYEDINFITLNNSIIYDNGDRKEDSKYDPKILNLNGKVWLIFTHPYRSEEEYILETLLNNGSEILEEKKYKGSSVYYIDTKNRRGQ